MILMGIVKAAYSTYLSISLPGRLVGKVPITSISKSYTNFLQTILETQDLTTVRKLEKQTKMDFKEIFLFLETKKIS